MCTLQRERCRDGVQKGVAMPCARKRRCMDSVLKGGAYTVQGREGAGIVCRNGVQCAV
jgi:hypothetical protein